MINFMVTIPDGQSAEGIARLLKWLHEGGHTDGVVESHNSQPMMFVRYGETPV